MLLPSRQLSCKNGKPCKKQNLQRWRKSREDLTREKPYAAEKAGAHLSRDYLERSCYCIDLLIFCGNFFVFSPLFFLKIILIFHTISEALQDIAFWCCQARLNSSYTYSTFLVLMVIFFPFCYLLTFSPTPVDSEAPLTTWRCCSHHCTLVLPLSSMAGREGVAHSRFLSLTWSKGFRGTARGACALYTSLISCHY